MGKIGCILVSSFIVAIKAVIVKRTSCIKATKIHATLLMGFVSALCFDGVISMRSAPFVFSTYIEYISLEVFAFYLGILQLVLDCLFRLFINLFI